MPRDENIEIVPSVCPHDCPSTCALDVERIDPRTIGRIHGAKSNTYTAGVVCAKVARYAERIHHPDRLLRPLRRVGAKGDGRFEPIAWDDALDRVAEAFLQAEQRHGSEAVWPYFYAGTMGFVQRDSIERLRHAKRYSRQHSTICVTLPDTGWKAGVGQKRGVDAREIAKSDLVVVWGANPVNTQVNLMSHITRARKERDATLVVVDAYRTATAETAHMHLAPRPGTDGALACAVMHVLFEEGFADRDYMARYADVPDELEAHLRTRTPEWAAGITGLPAERIVEFARLYGATKRSFIRCGYGFARSRNGAVNMHAVTCLPTVTGAWQYEGGGALYGQSGSYGLDTTMIEGLDVRDRATRLLDQSRIGPVLTGDKRDLGDGPPVAAMLVQNTNPMVVAPETLRVRDGLLRDDLFVCVHEQFMTETAALADIVLPATMFLEHDDMYIASGHTHLQVARKVIEPPDGPRPNHTVISALAERLGAVHPGFEMTAWQLIDHTLRASGYPGADRVADDRWVDIAPEFETAHFLDGFPTDDGRFRFAPDWPSIGRNHAGLPRLPDHLAVIDEADRDHPFRLVAAPARQFLNSTFTEMPTSRRREGRPTVQINGADCEALGIDDGDRVRLGNTRGSIVLHAKRTEATQRGVVVVESIWPNGAFEEGLGINTLISADPGLPKGGAVFHDSAIWIRPA